MSNRKTIRRLKYIMREYKKSCKAVIRAFHVANDGCIVFDESFGSEFLRMKILSAEYDMCAYALQNPNLQERCLNCVRELQSIQI